MTPPETVQKLLNAAGADLVLVGGQALAFWVSHYRLSRTGTAVPAISNDVDFLSSTVRKRIVKIAASGESQAFFVMHPLDVLHSRLASLYQLQEKQNDKGGMQLALAIDVARAFVQSQARLATPAAVAAGRGPVQAFVSSIERMAVEDAGRKVAKRYDLHVADAIDPHVIPAGPFWTKRWPALSKLMSPGYRATIRPPP